MYILTENWLYIMIGVTLLHWLLPAKLRGWWIVAASAGFLAVLSPISLMILTALTALYYGTAVRKDSISGRMLIGLILITGAILSSFKIYDSFFVTSQIDFTPSDFKFIIPLGLSYYAFRCIHYAIEKYKGTIPAHGLEEFAQFMFFLPTFLAGPIHRYHDFEKDIRRKRWDAFLFAQGLERIIYGYVKITFIANLLVTNLFGTWIVEFAGTHESLHAYLIMIKTFLSLYFQFSGYSDVAIGFGMLLGFKVMENFNFPFLARNISDFWRRWHISLTSWCRDYVYMGVMSTARNAALAATAAMLVMGLWHEFSLRFILWGIFHGIGITIWQQFQHIKPKLPQVQNKTALMGLRIFSTLLTLHYFMFGMLIATHADLSKTWEEWHKMLFFWS
jgi:D-alanyl-lipoteichoic acid acyltransferase DltB (MBOAT superfamily)